MRIKPPAERRNWAGIAVTYGGRQVRSHEPLPGLTDFWIRP